MGEANPPNVANASYKERSLVGNLKAPKTSRNDRHWIKKVHGVIHLAHMHIHNQKCASCSKSPIIEPISGCIRIACSGMITSLLQVVNTLAASCELHAGLMQVVLSTCNKSTNINFQQV